MKKSIYFNEDVVIPELNMSIQYKYGEPKDGSNLKVFAKKIFIPTEDGKEIVNGFKQNMLEYDETLVDDELSDEELFNRLWDGKYRLETHRAGDLGLYAICVAHDGKHPLEEELLEEGQVDCSLELSGYQHTLMVHREDGEAFLRDCRKQILQMAPSVAKEYKDDVELFNFCYELGLVDYYCSHEVDGKNEYYMFHSISNEVEDEAC